MPAFRGDNAQFAPTKTYTATLTVGKGASQIDLHYFGAAHTNGDTVIVFPALRIAQKAGRSVDDAFAAFSVATYPGYKNEWVKAAIQVIYDESK